MPKHEIIFVFDATLADRGLYQQEEITLHEAGWEGALRWVSLAECRGGAVALHPEGPLALLDGRGVR